MLIFDNKLLNNSIGNYTFFTNTFRKISVKRLYIISGWCDTTGRAPYQRLADIGIRKGYRIIKVNPEWDEPLRDQIFEVTKDDIVFGFSMGAILACMVGKRHCCKKLILASMTPVLDLSKPTLNMLGKQITSDFKKFRYGGVKATYYYGEKELDESLDRLRRVISRDNNKGHGNARTEFKIVPGACHCLTPEYVERVGGEL